MHTPVLPELCCGTDYRVEILHGVPVSQEFTWGKHNKSGYLYSTARILNGGGAVRRLGIGHSTTDLVFKARPDKLVDAILC